MPCYHWPLTLSRPLPVCKQCTLCHKTLLLPPLITFPYLFLRLFLTAVYTHDYGPSTQQSIETPPNPVSKVELAWFASNNQLWWEGSASCLERFQFARRRAEQHPIINSSWMGQRRAKQHPIILHEETSHGWVEGEDKIHRKHESNRPKLCKGKGSTEKIEK